MHYVMMLSVCNIYVTTISFMSFANKHIIIIIIKKTSDINIILVISSVVLNPKKLQLNFHFMTT